MMFTLAQAHAWVPGSALVGDGSVPITRVHTDSRSLQAGDLFVALKGERFDAHDFLPQARAAGAVAAIAERGLGPSAAEMEPGMPNGLRVADPLGALQALAGAWRARHALPLIAVTGSNGKTTVTQMIGAILRAEYGPAALATAGNLNNHIGVPLTLLRLAQDGTPHRAAVVELGMNHSGEIATLAALAQPTVALVNNAQREHQEFMHSVEAVARENGSVISALPADGVAVFPADDMHTALWRTLAGARRVMTFALDAAAADYRAASGHLSGTQSDPLATSDADVTGSARWQADGADAGRWLLDARTPAGPARIALRVAGRHNVKNALAATAAALAAGVPVAAIVRGLEAFEPVKGRSQVRSLQRHGRALTLIDDSYNANPDSVLAAIDVLADLPAPRWLVLGDMGEVGSDGARFHAEAGERARAGVHHFWCAGELSLHAARAYGARARHFADTTALVAALGDRLEGAPDFGAVLVKGSRFMRMERVVAALEQAAGGTDAA